MTCNQYCENMRIKYVILWKYYNKMYNILKVWEQNMR